MNNQDIPDDAFVAIVNHDIQVGKVDEAADRINGNGDRMAEHSGFLARHLLRAADGSNRLTTVTYWSSESAYNAWTKYNRANNPHKGKPSPYIGSPDTNLFVRRAE